MRFVCGVSDETALRLLKWSEFFLMFMLIIPVAVLLYQDKGITLGDFFLIQGLFRIAAFALEIPSRRFQPEKGFVHRSAYLAGRKCRVVFCL